LTPTAIQLIGNMLQLLARCTASQYRATALQRSAKKISIVATAIQDTCHSSVCSCRLGPFRTYTRPSSASGGFQPRSKTVV